MIAWKHIPLPKDLLKEAEETVENTKHWSSVSEFVRDAVREKISRVKGEA